MMIFFPWNLSVLSPPFLESTVIPYNMTVSVHSDVHIINFFTFENLSYCFNVIDNRYIYKKRFDISIPFGRRFIYVL